MVSKETGSEIVRAKELLENGKIKSAFEILNRIYDGKSPQIAVLLGYIYGEDSFVDRDQEKSFLHYIIAAEAGDPYAQQAIAAIFKDRGEDENALEWMKKASANGNFDASYLLYYYFKKRHEKALSLKFLKLASDQGNVVAKQRHAIEMLKGNYGIAKILLGVFSYFSNIPSLIRYAKQVTKGNSP